MDNTRPLSSVSFFCPAYNEEDNLERFIYSVLSVLQELAHDFEIIIVDNASTDRTPQIADQLAKNIPQIRVMHNTSNKGYGGALRTGFNSATKELVVYTDSDNQYDFNDFRQMIPYLSEYDIVTGYRLQRHDSRYRLFQSDIFNFLIWMLFGLRLKDINCSFKVYRKDVLDKIRFSSNSAFIDAEMLSEAKRKGFRICEVPVRHFARTAGNAQGGKPYTVIFTIKDIFICWLRSFFIRSGEVII
jgi:glycosyltransferase involved in cell wall biosynthesis